MIAEFSRTFWNNNIILLVGRALAKIATIGFVVISARFLGVEKFGLFNNIIAITVFAGIISDFGLMLPGIRNIAKSDVSGSKFVHNSISFRFILALIACISTAIFGLILKLPVNIIFILSIASIFEINGMTLVRSFEGISEFRTVSYYIVIERLLYGFFTVLFVILFKTVLALAISILITHTIFLFIVTKTFGKKFGKLSFHFSTEEIIFYVKIGFPFLLITIFSSIYYKIDTVLIGHFTSIHEVGIYNAAMRILDAQMLVPMTLMTNVFPQLSSLFHKKSERFSNSFQRFFFFMIGSGIAFTVATFFCSEWLIHLLYSEEFYSSVKILQILSLMLIFFFINALLFQTLVSMHKEIIFTGIMLASAILSVLGNIYFLHQYGIIAAAWVRVFIEMVTCLFTTFYVLNKIFKEKVHLQ